MPPWPSLGLWFSTLFTGLMSLASIVPIKQFVNGLMQSKGRNAGQALRLFWQQQVSQLIGLSGNRRVWERPFTLFWLTTLALLLSGSIYLLQTTPDAPHLIGLVLIVFVVCLFGFSLSRRYLTDAVPRSTLTLMAAAFLLAGITLQAEPDMEALIHSSLQAVTLNQIGAFTLVTFGLLCLLRPEQRLIWAEPVMLGLLTLGGAILQYGFGLTALQQVFPQLSADFAQTLNVLLIGTLIVLALFALFRAPKPLQNRSRSTLLAVAIILTPIQYVSSFQELQYFLGSNDASTTMLQQLVILSFVCTWTPIVCALLVLCIRQPWITRIALVVVASMEAMMFAYQGQQIPFPLFPGNTYPLSTPILAAETFSQLIGPILVLVAGLALFRLPRFRFFQALDHGALLTGSLICAILDDAFWQVQTAPLTPSMNQSDLNQQFMILAGRLPAIAIYLLLLGLPLALLTLAICHFWGQSHPQARIDPWLKRLRGTIILMERLLALALVIIALILQFFAGTLQFMLTSGTNWLSSSNPPDYLGLFVLILQFPLAIVGLVLLFRLFSRNPRELGRSERFALFLAVLSCLLFIGQNPDIVHLPLLSAKIQLTGNILHWPEGLIYMLFFVGLLIPPLLAILWVRRSFFTQYRELFRSAFFLVIACAILQFFWPILLLVGLIIFIASVLLLIQIEKVQ